MNASDFFIRYSSFIISACFSWLGMKLQALFSHGFWIIGPNIRTSRQAPPSPLFQHHHGWRKSRTANRNDAHEAHLRRRLQTEPIPIHSVQEKCRAEVESTLQGKELTYEDIKKMDFLHATLTEVMRLFSAAQQNTSPDTLQTSHSHTIIEKQR